MNKQTNELDRMIVGVREWAVEKTLRDTGYSGTVVDTKEILEYAQKLEDFVLREFPQFLSYLPVKEEID